MVGGGYVKACGMFCIAALGALAPPAHAQLNCNVGIEFHPNGGIARCIANGDHSLVIGGHGSLTCRDGAPIVLHADGKLARCTLRQARTLGERECPAGAQVSFDERGAFAGCSAAKPAGSG